MALIQEIPPGLTLPLVHSRSYLKTTKQTQTTLRHYPRKHVPRKTRPPADMLAIWNDWHAKVNRQYTKLILDWWAADNVPNGKAWWNSLAAANQVTTYKGTLKTITGKRFFLWFQKQPLDAAGYTTGPFVPNPVSFPLAPTLPWAPEAAPAVWDIENVGNTYIRWKTGLVDLDIYQGFGYWSPTPAPKQSSLLPQHEVTNAGIYGVTGEDFTYGTVTLAYLFPHLRQAQRIRVAFGLFNTVTNTPTPLTWFDFTYE